MPTPAVPTIAEVERIGALTDPVIRNLQITQCYHELAVGLAEFTGRSSNWCTYATWASKQAGQTIRKEDLARTFERVLGSDEAVRQAAQKLAAAAQRIGVQLGIDEIVAFIWKVWDPASAFIRSSEAVARGNLKVFAEIGREFARFYATCLPNPDFDAEKIRQFCEELRPGEPPEGQRYLRQAFQHYYQARFVEQAKARSELLLFANLEIGLHEQTRLQPEINEALGAPIIDPELFARDLIKALFPRYGWLGNIIWILLRLFGRLTHFEAASDEFAAAVRRQAQFIITETMMTIDLPPDRLLRLGQDLSAGFPASLQQIGNPELRSLLAQIDPTPDSTLMSGAMVWGDLPDRLHFIADMFRCFQESPELFAPPFTPDQTAALKDGRLPAGRI